MRDEELRLIRQDQLEAVQGEIATLRARLAEVERENERLKRQVEWLERNSVLRTPRSATIADYLAAKAAGDEETPCPAREDGAHCNCWYDGKACCACGDPADSTGAKP